MRLDCHPGHDLAGKVECDPFAFPEAGFDLHDIPVVYTDFDIPKLYHILSSTTATCGAGRNDNAAAGTWTPMAFFRLNFASTYSPGTSRNLRSEYRSRPEGFWSAD